MASPRRPSRASECPQRLAVPLCLLSLWCISLEASPLFFDLFRPSRVPSGYPSGSRPTYSGATQSYASRPPPLIQLPNLLPGRFRLPRLTLPFLPSKPFFTPGGSNPRPRFPSSSRPTTSTASSSYWTPSYSRHPSSYHGSRQPVNHQGGRFRGAPVRVASSYGSTLPTYVRPTVTSSSSRPGARPNAEVAVAVASNGSSAGAQFDPPSIVSVYSKNRPSTSYVSGQGQVKVIQQQSPSSTSSEEPFFPIAYNFNTGGTSGPSSTSGSTSQGQGQTLDRRPAPQQQAVRQVLPTAPTTRKPSIWDAPQGPGCDCSGGSWNTFVPDFLQHSSTSVLTAVTTTAIPPAQAFPQLPDGGGSILNPYRSNFLDTAAGSTSTTAPTRVAAVNLTEFGRAPKILHMQDGHPDGHGPSSLAQGGRGGGEVALTAPTTYGPTLMTFREVEVATTRAPNPLLRPTRPTSSPIRPTALTQLPAGLEAAAAAATIETLPSPGSLTLPQGGATKTPPLSSRTAEMVRTDPPTTTTTTTGSSTSSTTVSTVLNSTDIEGLKEEIRNQGGILQPGVQGQDRWQPILAASPLPLLDGEPDDASVVQDPPPAGSSESGGGADRGEPDSARRAKILDELIRVAKEMAKSKMRARQEAVQGLEPVPEGALGGDGDEDEDEDEEDRRRIIWHVNPFRSEHDPPVTEPPPPPLEETTQALPTTIRFPVKDILADKFGPNPMIDDGLLLPGTKGIFDRRGPTLSPEVGSSEEDKASSKPRKPKILNSTATDTRSAGLNTLATLATLTDNDLSHIWGGPSDPEETTTSPPQPRTTTDGGPTLVKVAKIFRKVVPLGGAFRDLAEVSQEADTSTTTTIRTIIVRPFRRSSPASGSTTTRLADNKNSTTVEPVQLVFGNPSTPQPVNPVPSASTTSYGLIWPADDPAGSSGGLDEYDDDEEVNSVESDEDADHRGQNLGNDDLVVLTDSWFTQTPSPSPFDNKFSEILSGDLLFQQGRTSVSSAPAADFDSRSNRDSGQVTVLRTTPSPDVLIQEPLALPLVAPLVGGHRLNSLLDTVIEDSEVSLSRDPGQPDSSSSSSSELSESKRLVVVAESDLDTFNRWVTVHGGFVGTTQMSSISSTTEAGPRHPPKKQPAPLPHLGNSLPSGRRSLEDNPSRVWLPWGGHPWDDSLIFKDNDLKHGKNSGDDYYD